MWVSYHFCFHFNFRFKILPKFITKETKNIFIETIIWTDLIWYIRIMAYVIHLWIYIDSLASSITLLFTCLLTHSAVRHCLFIILQLKFGFILEFRSWNYSKIFSYFVDFSRSSYPLALYLCVVFWRHQSMLIKY